VLAPWALAIEARLHERVGPGSQVLWSDDGIVIRLPEAVDRVPLDDLVFDPDDIDDAVVAALPGTALFASVFREAAARALLLPRRRPGERTPLWQQRQRSADLLHAAAAYPDFPILLEATRECLRDHFDVPALRDLLRSIRSRRVRVVEVDTDRASPFAQSLLFRWIAVFMYEGDAPLAERRAAALSLDKDLLRELLGSEDLRELLDPEALGQTELELQRLAPARQARGVDGVHDLLRDLGPLRDDEVAARTTEDATAVVAALLQAGRAIRVRIGGVEHVAATDDAGRLRDALGVAIPVGLPTAHTDPVVAPLEELVARFARTHAPFTTADVAARLGLGIDPVRASLRRLAAANRVLEGEFRPGGLEREWCDPDVLRRVRRRSLAALRAEVEPVDAAAFARFLPAWQGADRPRAGADALTGTIARLQGVPVWASTLERDVLPARVQGFRPSDLDGLAAAGELVWVGAGRGAGGDGRVSLLFRDQVATLAPEASDGERPAGPVHDAIRAWLAAHGASFWPDLVRAAGTADEGVVLGALWDLVWAAEVTNDTLAPLRAVLAGVGRRRGHTTGSRPRPGALRRTGPPAGAGRWSSVETLRSPVPAPTAVAHALAAQLLDRHGVVTREAVLGEGIRGGFSAVYPVLKAMEESGTARRGYFVAGLGAAQFAVPGAVDRLRSFRDPQPGETAIVTLAATDPAQPWGAALPWPEARGRPARVAGAYVVLASGSPAVFVERGGRTLVTFPGALAEAWAGPIAALMKDGVVRRMEVRQIDGRPARPPRRRGATRCRLRRRLPRSDASRMIRERLIRPRVERHGRAGVPFSHAPAPATFHLTSGLRQVRHAGRDLPRDRVPR